MSRITLGSSDLLEYNPDYGVLICRECEYAIQKSAVQSHLLRHKIYRAERQTLLSEIARFELREPDDVDLPDPTTRPIAALPILDGYFCLHDGCRNLCASVKRMRRHWADVHGGAENFGSMAREIKMQTFFRGTKIRYFEVSPELTEQMLDQEEATEEEDPVGLSEEQLSDSPESDNEQASNIEGTGAPKENLMSRMLLGPEYTPGTTPIGFDFEPIKSFHRFTSVLHLTLPSPGIDAMDGYWRTTVLPLALSRHWMMSGLLAIAEYHTVAFADDQAEIKTHELELSQRVTSFNSYPFQLKNLLTNLRSFSLIERNGNVNTPEEVFARAGQIFRRRSQSGASEENEGTIALLKRLDELPSRMSEVFGRPNDIKDVMATLAAIATLVEHYSATFTPDTNLPSPNSVWHSMVQWPSKVPENFHFMVSRHKPAALVVVAHWVSALVFRAEKCGYWFLRGLARKLHAEIAGRLRDTEGALGLIEGLSYGMSENTTMTG
ncbi:uncharacterized protein CC84DRAFT_1262938 [Paraphaeosphaeria sporulosa]|uniref:C2H2-type domain-containing protein n=1 Tax=Paraphaeosphaeria sporulosa TaxID=1460663 RepID=A0A177C1T7_9PLEO|nr:uncharacterized protein CC84DRAFT_1262938 [Paraphaeosphaeria sporulosa]OAG00849.1 hypothetical protein CC84DRAFT_1262938 [Paraphaeosphaeria sporulosa]